MDGTIQIRIEVTSAESSHLLFHLNTYFKRREDHIFITESFSAVNKQSEVQSDRDDILQGGLLYFSKH